MRAQTQLARDLNPGTVALELALVIGPGGSVSTFRGMGTEEGKPPRRTGPGQYTITLDQLYLGLVGFEPGMKRPAGVALVPTLRTENVSASPIVVVETLNGSTATDPNPGDVVFLKFKLDELGLPF
ncbi:hypothetical protein [Pendulispora albinea]|uniref:Peptidylprolyl isomerase n=1 Tax=Pendulispora albinea TaxID=2741071 RepID=A0ABZ2M049_9BACT